MRNQYSLFFIPNQCILVNQCKQIVQWGDVYKRQVSRYSPLPLPLPAGKVSTRLIWQVVALPLSIPAPSSGSKTGGKEDYKTAEINFLKSMTSTINNIAVASSVCGGLKRKNKNIRSQLIFLHQWLHCIFFKVILKEHGIIVPLALIYPQATLNSRDNLV